MAPVSVNQMTEKLAILTNHIACTTVRRPYRTTIPAPSPRPTDRPSPTAVPFSILSFCKSSSRKGTVNTLRESQEPRQSAFPSVAINSTSCDKDSGLLDNAAPTGLRPLNWLRFCPAVSSDVLEPGCGIGRINAAFWARARAPNIMKPRRTPRVTQRGEV